MWKNSIVLVRVCDVHLDRKYFWDKELVFKVSKAAGSGDSERKNIEGFLNLIAERKVGARARERVLQEYSIESVFSQYMATWRQAAVQKYKQEKTNV